MVHKDLCGVADCIKERIALAATEYLTPPSTPPIEDESLPSSLASLPEMVLMDVIARLGLKDRYALASTCRALYQVVWTGSLWQDIHINRLEFGSLVKLLNQLASKCNRVKSLSLSDCHSTFLQDTFVEIHHLAPSHQVLPMHAHITSLRPEGRKKEYCKREFNLHEQLSLGLTRLMEANQSTLASLSITGCRLDFESTDLVFSIIRYGRHLQEIFYRDNGDIGLGNEEVLRAIVASCPDMRVFAGHHLAMNDSVLRTILKGWPQLRHLTVAQEPLPQPFAPSLTQENTQIPWLSESGRSTGHGISASTLWDLLCTHPTLEHVDLDDIHCFNDLMLHRLATKPRRSKTLTYHPYRRRSSTTSLPRLRHLSISKYTCAPLHMTSFDLILSLFPNLKTLSYETNTYSSMSFPGTLTRVHDSITHLPSIHNFTLSGGQFKGRFDMPIKPEQRLLVSLQGYLSL